MTHHATNLDLPGEANITTAAGDVATFQSTGSNTVQCISYVKADGTPVVGGSAPEGTAVLSTGEAGGTKYLREDGDGTSSWQTVSGGVTTFTGGTTRNTATASGTQAITGVGFQPSIVIFMHAQNNTPEWSIGWDNDSESASALYSNHNITAEGHIATDTWMIECIHSADNSYHSNISSMDADGFTINWLKNGSPTGTLQIRYLCIQ
jgi:hypothetical protein